MTCDLSPECPDPQAQPPEFRPAVRDRVAQPVVSAVATAELEASGAGRQVEFVVHDEQLTHRRLDVIEQRADRRARCDSCTSGA